MMYDKLTEKGYPQDKLVFNKYERGTHLMVYWRNIFSEFLQSVFLNKVEALELGAKIDYEDKTDMRKQDFTEIKIDENDPRLLDKNNYVYYDNSETKWEKVCAFWWSDDEFASNIITGGFYESVQIGQNRKYLINVGSVGQPRDGDWRAAFAVFSPEESLVNLYRVEYDIATTQQKIIDAGLPPRLADRLAVGR